MSEGLFRRGWIRVSMLLSCLLLPTLTASAQQTSYFNQRAKAEFIESTPVVNRPFVVDIGPRAFLPGTDLTLDFSRGRAEVFVQFDEPLSVEQRREYIRAGVRFDRVYRPNTYAVRLPKSAAARLRTDPHFRGIEPVLPVDKLTEGLFRGQVHPWARRGDGYMAVNVRFYDNIQLRHALRVLDRWDVLVDDPSRYQYNERLLVYATHGQILVLAEEAAVRSLSEIPLPSGTDNVVAAALSNVDVVQAPPFGLTGDGVRIGIWDGGEVRTDHEQLTGRVTLRDNSGPNDHSTHVAGTMIGDGTGMANAMGMAPGAERLYSWDYNGNPATEQDDCWNNDWIILANHSWGTVLGWAGNSDVGGDNLFGYYDDVAEDWDALVYWTGLLVQKSSGNDGNDCDPGDPNDCDGEPGSDGWAYHTIGTQGNAKNILTVGAVNGIPILTGFSSTGPTDDFRIKPDVVAKGDSLWSAWAQGVTIPEEVTCVGQDYCSIGGTSMSTPTVTGGLALLVELYRSIYSNHNPAPEVMKAVVVNTAQDLGRVGPDYAYGHGLFDALAAAELIQVGPVHIVTDSVTPQDLVTYLVKVPAGTPLLKVTSAWTDFPGLGNSGLPALENDLDLKLISPGGQTFYPWSGPTGDPTDPATNDDKNSVDNVETVEVSAPQTGFWQVQMYGDFVPFSPQDFAIVSNLPFWLPDQPEIDVNADLTFDEHCPGDVPSQKTFSIFNTGGAMLLVHDVELLTGTNFHLAPNPAPPFVLLPGSHIEMTLEFDPQMPGLWFDTLRITSNDVDEGVIELPVEGRGGAADINATMEAKGWFGHVPLGSYQTLEMQLINQGTCDLTVTDLFQAFGSTEFTRGEIVGIPAFPFVIFPGEAVSVMMKYEPDGFGADTATFIILSDDALTPSIHVDMSGQCDPPDITISGSLDFGEVCPGELAEKDLDICNTGVSDLLVSSVGWVQACGDFTIVNNPFPATVSHDFCLPVTIRYTPTGVGYHECTLEIISNDPDEPVVHITVTGTTPPIQIDVAPDVAFPPTVIQDVYACSTERPFSITNIGDCPMTVTDFQIVQPGADYSVIELPTLPATLMPGEELGEGDLRLVFAPYAVIRHSEAQVQVTYVTNAPAMGDTETVTRDLCGEGTRTGVRVLITHNDVPVTTVEHLYLYEVLYAGTTEEELQIVTLEHFMPLLTEPANPPCDGYQYHREWGALDDPLTLTPARYQIVAKILDNGVIKTVITQFDLDSCTFFHDLRMDVDY